jgi:hypothetical protein
MKKFKCILYYHDMDKIQSIIQERIHELQSKKYYELSEIVVYRLFALLGVEKRINSKMRFLDPRTPVKMSFDLKEALILKFCLLDRLTTPGLSKIFMQLDSTIHPAIHLEL